MTDPSPNSCRLCGAATTHAFRASVLTKHEIEYQHCRRCDYLQTETPHWLEVAYSRPITLQDTGVLQRNLMLSRALALMLFAGGMSAGRFLDYAGGYGVMTRLMRDLGFDYYWCDPYTQNLFACGFEAPCEGRYDAISAFEVLEHLVEPAARVAELLRHTDTLVCSTELRPETIPPLDWPYYGFAHGQHVGFFSQASLTWMAGRLDLRLLTDGGFFHVLTRRTDLALPPFGGRKARRQMRALRRQMRSLTEQDSQRA